MKNDSSKSDLCRYYVPLLISFPGHSVRFGSRKTAVLGESRAVLSWITVLYLRRRGKFWTGGQDDEGIGSGIYDGV